MAIHVFRPPVEGLEKVQSALDMIALIRQIATDPNIGDVVDDLSQRVLNTHELTEAKKKQAADAEEIIAQAKEAADDLATAKKEHDTKVAGDLKGIEQARNDLDSDVAQFNKNKEITQKQLDNFKSATEEKLALSQKLSNEAIARHAKAEKLERDLADTTASHAQAVAQFEKDKVDAANDYAQKLEAHESNVRKLTENQQAFELRKKKFEDALKG